MLLSFLCPFRTGTQCTFSKEDSAGLMKSYCLQAVVDNFCKVCLKKNISTSKAVYQLLSSTGKKDTYFVLETVRRTKKVQNT